MKIFVRLSETPQLSMTRIFAERQGKAPSGSCCAPAHGVYLLKMAWHLGFFHWH